MGWPFQESLLSFLSEKSLSTSSDNYVSEDLYFPILSVPLFFYSASADQARHIDFCSGLLTMCTVYYTTDKVYIQNV